MKTNYVYKLYKKFGWVDNFPFQGTIVNHNFLRGSYYELLQAFSLLDGHQGINFLERGSWNYAIVLDACRYDVFKKVNFLDGKLEKFISPASATMEWIRKCVTHYRSDIVMVAANPHFSPIKLREYTGKSNRFYKNIPAWDIGYDDELKVAPPWAMVEIAKKRIDRYENKKME